MPNRDPFLSALPDSRRARLAAIPELDALLARHLASAHAAWPALDLADEIFLGHLAMRLPESAGEAELAALHASDLYLACACAGGSEPAIRLFEAAYFAEVDRAARQVGADLSLAVEAKQILRRRLFVADGDKPAAAALFAGRGDLRGWLRVAATRELVALVGRQRRDLALDDERLLDLFAAADDPALAYLRERYRDPCNQAFRAALAALPARQRSLLRYQLDGPRVRGSRTRSNDSMNRWWPSNRTGVSGPRGLLVATPMVRS